MATYFVSRHDGARQWAARRGVEAAFLDHLDIAQVKRGDVVIGALPAHLVVAIGQRGARYVHLVLDVPPAERGRSLSAEEMERFGARLIEIRARAIGPFPAESASRHEGPADDDSVGGGGASGRC
jgi:CRISPR-associated protein Csx16